MLAFPSHLSSLGVCAIPLYLAIATPLHRVNKQELHTPPDVSGAGTISWRPCNPADGPSRRSQYCCGTEVQKLHLGWEGISTPLHAHGICLTK